MNLLIAEAREHSSTLERTSDVLAKPKGNWFTGAATHLRTLPKEVDVDRLFLMRGERRVRGAQ